MFREITWTLVTVINFINFAVITSSSETISLSGNSSCRNLSCATSSQNWRIDSALVNRERKWISYLYLEAKMAFDMASDVNENCKRDFVLYKSHLRNQTIWAVRMMDSSEWPIEGIFSGTTHFLGNWPQCMRITSSKIAGRYCLVSATIDIPMDVQHDSSKLERLNTLDEENYSAWDILKKYGEDTVFLDRRKLNWAMCVPSSCHGIDLKISLIRTLYPIFQKNNLSLTVDVNPQLCSARDEIQPQFSHGYYYTKVLLYSIIFLVITSSVNDVYGNKTVDEEKWWLWKAYMCFSIVQNYKNLVNAGNVEILGLSFMKICGVIPLSIAHRWMFSFKFPLYQTEEVEIQFASGSLFFLSMSNYLDCFFMMSGFFLYRMRLESLGKNGILYLLFNIILRQVRIIPVLGISILFVAYILPNLGDGPLWNWYTSKASSNCKSSGWMNILGINNFADFREMCFSPSWHTAVDFQLTVLGIILLFILARKKKLGLILSGLIFILSTMVMFVVAYINKFCGFFNMSPRFMTEEQTEFNQIYTAMYPRLGPYLVGFLAGYVTDKLQKKNFKLSFMLTTLIEIVIFYVIVRCQYYGFSQMRHSENSQTLLVNAIYSGFYRTIFTICFAILLCLHITSGLGILDYIVNRKIYAPLGRLTYCVSTADYVFLLFQLSRQRIHMPVSSQLSMYMLSVSQIIFSFLFGFLLHLMVEAPANGILSLISQRIFRKKVQNKKD